MLKLIREVTTAGIAVGGGENDGQSFRKDCMELVWRISLLTHLLKEIREFCAQPMDDATSAATVTFLMMWMWSRRGCLIWLGLSELLSDFCLSPGTSVPRALL